jgi:hypothetical protein
MRRAGEDGHSGQWSVAGGRQSFEFQVLSFYANDEWKMMNDELILIRVDPRSSAAMKFVVRYPSLAVRISFGILHSLILQVPLCLCASVVRM